MDLQTRKISFIQEFLKLQDEEIVTDLEAFLRKRRIELLENELKPMSLEQFNADIDQSLRDEKDGRVIELSQLRDKIKAWK